MIRRIAAGLVFVMAFLVLVAEAQRYDDLSEAVLFAK
jgi:hypothetical protein